MVSVGRTVYLVTIWFSDWTSLHKSREWQVGDEPSRQSSMLLPAHLSLYCYPYILIMYMMVCASSPFCQTSGLLPKASAHPMVLSYTVKLELYICVFVLCVCVLGELIHGSVLTELMVCPCLLCLSVAGEKHTSTGHMLGMTCMNGE